MTGKNFTLRARAQTVAVREKAGGDVKLKPDTMLRKGIQTEVYLLVISSMLTVKAATW